MGERDIKGLRELLKELMAEAAEVREEEGGGGGGGDTSTNIRVMVTILAGCTFWLRLFMTQ